MDIENKNEEIGEQTTLSNNDNVPEVKQDANDELRNAIEETLSNIRRQSMLLGAQTILQTVLDKITVFENKPGSKSNNDHKRLIKDIKNFCQIGLSHKVGLDGETEPASETVQN